VVCGSRELAGSFEQQGPFEGLVGQVYRALEGALRVFSRRECGGSLGCAHEPVPRPRLDRCGILIVGGRPLRIQEVSGDDLGDLVRVDAGVSREVRRGGEVLRLPITSAERLVRDPLHERLQEAVLASLGRAGIGVEHEHLLPHERRQQGRE
jgi:hypothetical protein